MALSPSLQMARIVFKWRRLRRNFEVGRQGLCLDVGSGDAPWPRADVLLEAQPGDPDRALVVDRPLVLGSVEALPFRDGAFGYVYASHVLEHVTQPGKAVCELARVGQRGYLEVPSSLHEQLWPRPDHLWAVHREDHGLHFVPAPSPNRELVSWFAERLKTDARLECFYWSRYFDDFVHALPWRGSIPCRVSREAAQRGPGLRPPPPGELESLLRAARERGARPRARAKRLFGRLLGAGHPSLDGLLACPSCRGLLERSGDGFDCQGCDHRYPVVDGVPVLYPSGDA